MVQGAAEQRTHVCGAGASLVVPRLSSSDSERHPLSVLFLEIGDISSLFGPCELFGVDFLE